MRAYEIVAGSSSLDGLRRCERPDPVPLPTQVLVRIQAASLNYRDLLIARGHYMGGTVPADTIPLSDGTGEVVAVGAAVTRFRVGDRVASTFFRAWIDGKPPRGPLVALGAPPADGMLAELVVLDEQNAVAVPAHLSSAGAAIETSATGGASAGGWKASLGSSASGIERLFQRRRAWKL